MFTFVIIGFLFPKVRRRLRVFRFMELRSARPLQNAFGSVTVYPGFNLRSGTWNCATGRLNGQLLQVATRFHRSEQPKKSSALDRVIKLLGLSQERHQVSVAVANDTIPPEKLVGWRETQSVPESAFETIYELCRKLSEPPTAKTTAMIGPPADSPLWHDDEEEKPN